MGKFDKLGLYIESKDWNDSEDICIGGVVLFKKISFFEYGYNLEISSDYW